MSSATVPQAVQSCHELLQWLIPQLDKFPRSRRFTLGERIEAGLLEVLELLVEAAYTRNKDTSLRRANLKLEVVRPLWRIGIPIGNLTSQFFANLYLDDFDQYVKHELKVRPYLRYVDDMVVLDHDKTRLAEIRAAVKERLAIDRLWLHPRKAHIFPVAAGLNLLGYVVLPNRRRLRNDNGHRFVRTFRRMAEAYQAGRLEWSEVVASTQSWIGHAQHADTEGLRRAIFSQAVFRRGMGQETASV
jgi:hypothetical protein